MTDSEKIIFTHEGVCDVCECPVTFSATNEWFREFLLCSKCESIPRERALMRVIKEFFPNFSELAIHETSPVHKGPSARMAHDCPHYSSSHFFPSVTPGEIDPKTGFLCQDLENLTFEDESFDLFVSQDVFEHLFDPEAAFRQVCRILKPGGGHIFTVPIPMKTRPTMLRASKLENGRIVHHVEPEYHGNPVDEKGSLVTRYWGYDIVNFILAATNMPTIIIQIDDIDHGIRGEGLDVLVSLKISQQKIMMRGFNASSD